MEILQFTQHMSTQSNLKLKKQASKCNQWKYYCKYYSFASWAIWSLWSLKTRKHITVIYHWLIIEYVDHTPTKTYKWKTLAHVHTDTHDQSLVCQTYWPFRPILYKHTMLRTIVSWHDLEWFSAYNKSIQWLSEFYESKSSKLGIHEQKTPCKTAEKKKKKKKQKHLHHLLFLLYPH